MKNLIITITLAVLSVFSSAQVEEMEIIWGQPYHSKKSVVTDIISSDDGEIYAIKRNLGLFNQDVFIERYNDLEPIGSSEISFEEVGRFDVMKNIIKLGKDLWMLNFKSNYDEASLDAHYLDKETLNPLGEVVPIFDLSLERRLRYAYGGFDYVISRDEQKIAFVTQYPGDKDDHAELGLQVHDNRFDLLWEYDLELPYKKELVDITGIDVSSNGQLLCLIKVFEPKSEFSTKRSSSFQYHLITADGSGKHHDAIIALESGNPIQHLHFEITKEQEVILAGFYGSGCCDILGTFFLKLDENQKLKQISTEAFGIDFITQGSTLRQREKLGRKLEKGQELGLDKVDFRNFILRSDGSVVLIGELYAVAMTSRNGSESYPSHFNYKDIIVVSISASGEIEWSKKILKRQLTTDDGGFMSSFVLAVNHDKLHIVFNDHMDNLGVEKMSELNTYSRNPKTSIVAMVSLDRMGGMQREKLISQKELGLEIRPQSCEQISANELILFGMNRSENQLARIIF